MRIVLAASIYPPEVGGPSYYAKELREALERQGHRVVVVTYGVLKRLPSGVRHLCFAIKILLAGRADAIVAFDTYSGGAPAFLASLLLRTPLVVRVGGDFIWELYVERSREMLPLPNFYQKLPKLSLKERVIFFVSRRVTRRARVVFSSSWQRDIWLRPYDLDTARTYVIENTVPKKSAYIAAAQKNFVMYGRQIALKNAAAFRRAFNAAKTTRPDISLEEGMLPRGEYEAKLSNCYALALPSISDVTPNSILEALAHGKPFLLTKYSAYADRFKEYGVLVDPLDEVDMRRGIESICDAGTYRQLVENIARFNEVRTYDDVAREFVGLMQN